MQKLRAAGILVLFFSMALLCIPVQWLGLRLHSGFARWFPQLFHRTFCRLMGAKITVIGSPAKGGVLMTSNHTGWLDIPVLSTAAQVSFVAKQEVGAWVLFGTLARLQRTVFIRREKSKALEDRNNIRKRLAGGDALVIFPEGTSSDGNRVLSFKSALLSAAEMTLGQDSAGRPMHVPVQPISIAYVALHGLPMGRENRPFFAWYGDMEMVPHLWGCFEAGPFDVVIEFHKPITIDEAGGRKQLAAACEAAVRAGLVRAIMGDHATAEPQHDDELIEALAEEEGETEEAA